MYQVTKTGERFDSFMKAIAAGKVADSEVLEIATGLVRWNPAPKVTEKKMRIYRERLNAYAAQKAQK